MIFMRRSKAHTAHFLEFKSVDLKKIISPNNLELKRS